MKTDVLQLLRDARDLTHIIVLTYNLDFRFVQWLLCPVLRRCGHPSLLIFADARRAAESFGRGGSPPPGLGVRYRVVPVAMAPGFAFHPKAVLLSGPDHGTLLVGSGNLSFGGWRENGELWVRRDTDRDGTAAFAAFYAYVRRIVDRVPLPAALSAELDAAFDGSTRAWARDMAAPDGLIGRVGEGPSLLERMRNTTAARRVTAMTIAAPYFDADAHAVAALSVAFGTPPTTLLVPRTGNNLLERAAAALPRRVTLRSTQFTHAPDSEHPRDAFLHAKFYALAGGPRVDLFVGSANASRAALTLDGDRGNAELLAHVKLDAAEYQDRVLAELAIADTPPVFAAPAEDDDREPAPMLQILAARHAGEVLQVAFRAPPAAHVTSCLLDGVEARLFTVDEQILRLQVSGPPPRTVALRGLLDGALIASPLAWVDQEEALQASSLARTLAQEIRQHIRDDDLDVRAWASVFDVFCRHLQALPPVPGGTAHADRQGPTGPDQTFTDRDVFVDTELPIDTAHIIGVPGARGQAALLQALMLRWFHGRRETPPAEDDEPPAAPDSDDDLVDDPLPPPPPPPPSSPRTAPSPADLKRFERLVGRLQTSMSDAAFLERRPPTTLAGDLCLAAVLLRTGLREQWMNHDRFLAVTHDIWRALFLATPTTPTCGWIERRHADAPDPAVFRKALGGEHVTAALAAWALTDLPRASTSPRHARFVLAALLSVARNEWLWAGGDLRVVANELATYVAVSGESREQLADAWRLLIRRGRALGRLESILRTGDARAWRALVTRTHLARGELLWQGEWCITTEACARIPDAKVPVLKLHGDEAPTFYRATYTVPVRDLPIGIPPTSDLAALLAEVVADFT